MYLTNVNFINTHCFIHSASLNMATIVGSTTQDCAITTVAYYIKRQTSSGIRKGPLLATKELARQSVDLFMKKRKARFEKDRERFRSIVLEHNDIVSKCSRKNEDVVTMTAQLDGSGPPLGLYCPECEEENHVIWASPETAKNMHSDYEDMDEIDEHEKRINNQVNEMVQGPFGWRKSGNKKAKIVISYKHILTSLEGIKHGRRWPECE